MSGNNIPTYTPKAVTHSNNSEILDCTAGFDYSGKKKYIYISKDKVMTVDPDKTTRCKPRQDNHSALINNVSAMHNSVATADAHGEINILYRTKDGMLMKTIHTKKDCASRCALSKDSKYVTILIQNEKQYVIVVYRLPNIEQVRTWTFSQRIEDVIVGKDSSQIFYLTSERQGDCTIFEVKVLSIKNEKPQSVWKTKSKSQTVIKTRPAIKCDSNGEVLIYASPDELVALRFRDGLFKSAKRVSSFEGHSTTKSSVTTTYGCDISQDGSHIIAAVSGNKLGVWDLKTLNRIATLKGHKSTILTCATTDSRNIFLSGDAAGFFNVWQLNEERKEKYVLQLNQKATKENRVRKSVHFQDKKSVLVKQTLAKKSLVECFTYVLNEDPDDPILNEQFLTEVIRPSKVISLEDLLAGHNLILLAIRFGILTRQNIHSFRNNTIYFEENLYLPATEISNEGNQNVIGAILNHAKLKGIIPDQSCLTLNGFCQIRKDMKKYHVKLVDIVISFYNRIEKIEQSLVQNEARMNISEKKENILFNGVNELIRSQKGQQKVISSLSKNFDNLEDTIKRGNRRGAILAVFKGIISLVPLFGTAIGNIIESVVNLPDIIDAPALVQGFADGSKAAVSSLCIDLSDFRVAEAMLSENAINKLEKVERDVLTRSIEKSSLKSEDNLRAMLHNEVERMEKENRPLFIDIGSVEWKNNQTEHMEKTSHKDDWKRCANLHFAYATRKTSEENQVLSIGQATDSINQILRENFDYDKRIKQKVVEEEFFKIAGKDSECVNKKIFLELVSKFYKERKEAYSHQKKCQIFKARFQKAAKGRSYVSYDIACVIIRNVCKDLNVNVCSTDELKNKLKHFDENKNKRIEKREFMEVVHGIVLPYKKNVI